MGILLYRVKNHRNEYSSKYLENLSHFKNKLWRNVKDYGLWISSKKVFFYALQPVYRKICYYLYELDLNRDINHKIYSSKYEFRMINANDNNLIEQIERMEEWLKGSLKKKLLSNCLCMAVLDKDRVIGFNYASIGEGNIPHLKLQIITGPTEAWSEQITISSDYRRQGLANLLRENFYRELKSHGITALYGHRHESNLASKQSAKKYTHAIMARAEYRRIFGIHRLKCEKVPLSVNSFNNGEKVCKEVTKSRTDIKENESISTQNGRMFTVYIDDLK